MLWVGRNVSTEKKQHKTFLVTDIKGQGLQFWPQEQLHVASITTIVI